jgi:hypothetical protein
MKKREEKVGVRMDAVLQYWHDLTFTLPEEMFDNGPGRYADPKGVR